MQNTTANSFELAYWQCAPTLFEPIHAPEKPVLPEIDPDPEVFVREQLGLHPEPKQLEILRGRHERLLINCARQWGKSTIAAAAALHRLLMNPGKKIVVICPFQSQSTIFIGIFKDFMRRLGMKPRGDGENRVSALLPNGSRIIGLPGRDGGRVRGFSGVIMLIVDEAARLDDSVFNAAYPMVSSNKSDLWALTTPLGKRGFFYQNWAHGGDEWERVAAPATECPRISAPELERARRMMGDDWVRQEYLCEFIDIDGGIFSRDSIEQAFRDDISVLGSPEWN